MNIPIQNAPEASGTFKSTCHDGKSLPKTEEKCGSFRTTNIRTYLSWWQGTPHTGKECGLLNRTSYTSNKHAVICVKTSTCEGGRWGNTPMGFGVTQNIFIIDCPGVISWWQPQPAQCESPLRHQPHLQPIITASSTANTHWTLTETPTMNQQWNKFLNRHWQP